MPPELKGKIYEFLNNATLALWTSEQSPGFLIFLVHLATCNVLYERPRVGIIFIVCGARPHVLFGTKVKNRKHLLENKKKRRKNHRHWGCFSSRKREKASARHTSGTRSVGVSFTADLAWRLTVEMIWLAAPGTRVTVPSIRCPHD